jgi:serralysin
LNQGIYTVMSYNDGYASVQNPVGRGIRDYGYAAGPMAFDIAALQFAYGANMTTRTGDTTYVMPDANKRGTAWTCIWDAGGTDTIVYNGARATTIDLRDATLDNSPTGGGVPTFANGVLGGFTIANGVEIENATGGKGNDRIYANEQANVLNGRAGNDIVFGGDNADRQRYLGRWTRRRHDYRRRRSR